MTEMEEKLPKGVKWLQLPENVDERGRLAYLEGCCHIPFRVERVFWIYDVPSSQTRGGHAHWTCHEALFAVAGGFELAVDDGERSAIVAVNDPSCGILVPAGVWCELRHFRPGTVCVVMASEAYDASGYARTRSQWESEIRRKREQGRKDGEEEERGIREKRINV